MQASWPGCNITVLLCVFVKGCPEGVPFFIYPKFILPVFQVVTFILRVNSNFFCVKVCSVCTYVLILQYKHTLIHTHNVKKILLYSSSPAVTVTCMLLRWQCTHSKPFSSWHLPKYGSSCFAYCWLLHIFQENTT